MTETKWLKEELQPGTLLKGLKANRRSIRKCRLFACACYRRIWPLLSDQIRLMVAMMERVADGKGTPHDLITYTEVDYDFVRMEVTEGAACAAEIAAKAIPDEVDQDGDNVAYLKERKAQCSLLRDIFGNPFHSLSFNPTWRTSTVQQLAEAIYQEKAFDRLPILADALEDAGCDSAELVNHLRQPSEHVRGCWALDAVLGKE